MKVFAAMEFYHGGLGNVPILSEINLFQKKNDAVKRMEKRKSEEKGNPFCYSWKIKEMEVK